MNSLTMIFQVLRAGALCAVSLLCIQSSVAMADENKKVMLLQYDKLGSLVAVYDQVSGEPILTQQFNLWGNRNDEDGKSLKTRMDEGLPMYMGYRSQRTLLNNGIILMGSALYNPDMRRYYNPVSGGSNSHAFMGNNPLR